MIAKNYTIDTKFLAIIFPNAQQKSAHTALCCHSR